MPAVGIVWSPPCPCYIVHNWFMCWQDSAVSGRTTNFSRTIATLQGVLTGLYPDTPQPIPVATASDIDEIMFANVLSCEKLADVMKRARYKLRGTEKFVICVSQPPNTTACRTLASTRSGPACAWLRPWHTVSIGSTVVTSLVVIVPFWHNVIVLTDHHLTKHLSLFSPELDHGMSQCKHSCIRY